MSSIPTRLTGRDAIIVSLARINGSLMYACTEANRQGQFELEEDLHQIWREIVRVEADCARIGRSKLRTRPRVRSETLPGI